ncbi:MAG: malto-oligosyltrehalose synthase [Sphingobium sp.]
MMIPRATYRLQLTREFPFSAAQAIVPYLADLGISHIYASPITTARSGSTHGYDVVDPTRINPKLGGDAGFRDLVATLRDHDMGIVIDIVPNHMGVAGGENGWWNDVLRHGPKSRYSRFFDINWSGPLILPILGATLGEVIAAGDLSLCRDDDETCLILYGEQRLPLRPETVEGDDLRAIADAQHYRLVDWRTANDCLNWRRFFAINDLAGLRVEDAAVFDATHALYLDLYRQGMIDGVRVDHIDGLTDPAGYGRRLRAAFDAIRPGAWIIVEKILAPDEQLPGDWGIDGTSGYDFMRDVTALLHDPAGEAPLIDLWRAIDPDHGDASAVVLDARREMLAWQFEGQLQACTDAFLALAGSARATDMALEGFTPAMIRRAIERLLWVFPVYRTYGDGHGAPPSDGAVRDQAWQAVQRHAPPGEARVARQILDWLAGCSGGERSLKAEAVRRFQQLSAPIAAKGVEDTAFYRYAPLLSVNDVGSEPGAFALSPADFHARVQARATGFPHAMLATATHDHKRGEDMRARLAVLSATPGEWRRAVAGWTRIAEEIEPAIHPADRYQIFQTLLGAWPDAADMADFNDRVAAWLTKNLREARLRSSWDAPDNDYEMRAHDLLHGLIAHGGFRQEMDALIQRIAPAALGNSLIQTALKYCLPGVPDLYQGAELMDLSLVDPDNRRQVDYDRRAKLLADGGSRADARKITLIRQLLRWRRAWPDLFEQGAYHSLPVTGPRADHVLAFERTHGGKRLTCAVALHMGSVLVSNKGKMPSAAWWADTQIGLQPAIAAAHIFEQELLLLNLD